MMLQFMRALSRPGWRNGRRGGLKIRYWETSMRVRIPLPAPETHEKKALAKGKSAVALLGELFVRFVDGVREHHEFVAHFGE